MKKTYWIELLAENCTVLKSQRGEFTGNILSIQIKHDLLKRPRWFTPSLAGNFYSRYTGRESQEVAEGYIIKGKLKIA